MSERKRYRCWSDDMGEGPEDAGDLFDSTTLQAAIQYAERSYNDEPWEGAMRVTVQEIGTTEAVDYNVYPEARVDFCAEKL
jgi:hypothetical protein